MSRRNFVAEATKSFQTAINTAFPGIRQSRAHVSAGGDGSFGHLQCNNAMRIFNELKLRSNSIASPQAVAQQIIAFLPPSDVVDTATVAGPGFINVTLKREFVADAVCQLARQGPAATEGQRQHIIVDFSSPNVAKEMHVGHLRSTIIGDTLSRVLEFAGHDVCRINHVGDWGTQFGMLVAYMKSFARGIDERTLSIADLQQMYQSARLMFDSDLAFKSQAQSEVRSLQGGNEESLKIWRVLCDVSRADFQLLYQRLGIELVEKGESFYNGMIPSVIAELTAKAICQESLGAKVVFVDGKNFPLIIEKTDGGYGYDTTDVAAVRHRLIDGVAQRVIYVTDRGQAEHFAMVFDVAQRAGWDRHHSASAASLEHVGFGLVLGEDGKKFRTRSGSAVGLMDLLDEAEARCLAVLQSRFEVVDGVGGQAKTHLSADELQHAARAIGHGAVKYADLRQNRLQDYRFSFDKMLDLRGNTAVYQQYTLCRMWSILRKAKWTPQHVWEAKFCAIEPSLDHAAEMQLAVCLLRFCDVIDSLQIDMMPNRLTDYIYELSTKFNIFFAHCPVVGNEKQDGRLLLCAAAVRVLHCSLELLGITPLDRI